MNLYVVVRAGFCYGAQRMTFDWILPRLGQIIKGSLLLTCGLALAACATTDVDDTTGSHLTQPPPSPTGEQQQRLTTDVDDVAIAGQEAAHAILDLPVVANAATPPLVQFGGVTSIVGPVPVDTEPYTILLRDRLLLLTRLKLRFIERTLPPYSAAVAKKSKKAAAPSTTPVANSTDPDYKLLAELRGKSTADLYRIQIQFVDAHTGDVLYDGLFRIRKEAGGMTTYESAVPTSPQSTTVPADSSIPPQAPQDPNYYQPQPQPAGSSSLQ